MLGFRVWDSVEKTMVHGYDLSIFMIDSFGDFKCAPVNAKVSTRYIPMQSTGLKDCNGLTIFEGDVLLARFRGTNYQKKITVDEVVEFVQYEYTCAEYSGVESLEIIGNKWQNPELLEKTSC